MEQQQLLRAVGRRQFVDSRDNGTAASRRWVGVSSLKWQRFVNSGNGRTAVVEKFCQQLVPRGASSLLGVMGSVPLLHYQQWYGDDGVVVFC